MSTAALEQAELFMIWTLDEGSEQARRGHAYVFAERERARWITLEHSSATTPKMLEILTSWQAAHPMTPELEVRRRMHWADPSGRWRFTGDLGDVREMLLTRELVQETYAFGEAGPSTDELPPLPEEFLAGPITCLVRARFGPLDWPAQFEAPHVCLGPVGLVSARAGDELVVCAARPGSIHAGSGQTRTAAVWCSHDGGAQWEELSWDLDPDYEQPASWPPEQIERVSLRGGPDPKAVPAIEWEDPWSAWEPGDQWRAVWVPAEPLSQGSQGGAQGRPLGWRVTTRD
jgi:hypothetical protein